MKKRVVIFVNGDLPALEMVRPILISDDFVVAADGGAKHALALGFTPDVVIGDFDSISNEVHQKMIEAGVEIVRFPRDKNETDLELAIHYAIRMNPTHILIVAALGNRLDQTLGNISLLTDTQFSDFNMRLDDGVEEVFFCWEQAEIHGRIGDIISLIPWQRDVTQVVTSGLKWPLHGETLSSNRTRGISNEMTDETAEVQIKSGLLLVIHTRTASK